MRRRQAGLTLIEMMIVIGVLSVVTALVTSLLMRQREWNLVADGYAADIQEAHRVLDAVERDLRAARTVESPAAGAWTISTGRGDVAWNLEGNTLYRRAVGARAHLARNVERFDLAEEGGTWRVLLQPGRRTPNDEERAVLVRAVLPRAGGGGR